MKVFEGWTTWPDAEEALAGRLPDDAITRLGEAHRFIGEHQTRQTTPAGDPSPTRLLEVLDILVFHLGVKDVDLLAAALVHDVVEGTQSTLAEVRARFGETTAAILAGDRLDRPNSTSPDALRLALAHRYSIIQRLHTHPSVAGQRSCYAETCERFLPAAATDPGLNDLFARWREAYDYLDGQAVDTLPAADKLAAAHHRGQVDKSGHPYVEHVRAAARIARDNGGTHEQQMAALLHNTVEDTTCTLQQLADLGAPPAVAEMVDALTHRPDEPQVTYLARLTATPAAILVKRADISHNSSPDRLAQLDPKTRERLRRKYTEALTILDSAT